MSSRKDRQTGIFDTWDEVEPLVKKFKGAKYQGYSSRDDAEQAWRANQAAAPSFATAAGAPAAPAVCIRAAAAGVCTRAAGAGADAVDQNHEGGHRGRGPQRRGPRGEARRRRAVPAGPRAHRGADAGASAFSTAAGRPAMPGFVPAEGPGRGGRRARRRCRCAHRTRGRPPMDATPRASVLT